MQSRQNLHPDHLLDDVHDIHDVRDTLRETCPTLKMPNNLLHRRLLSEDVRVEELVNFQVMRRLLPLQFQCSHSLTTTYSGTRICH